MVVVKVVEEDMLMFIQENLRVPVLNEIMIFITTLCNYGAFWAVLAIVFLLVKKYRKIGVMMFVSLVFTFVISNMLLKNAMMRVRPYDVIEGLKSLVGKQVDWSFPSGHAASSLGAAIVMLKTMPRIYGVSALIFSILVCFSRMYVGVHYPTDVICGAIIGVISGIVSVKLVEKRIEVKKYE